MTAIGATREHLQRQKHNLERRRAELKQLLGIKSTRQHKNFKRRFKPGSDPELVREYLVSGKSIERLDREIARMKEAEACLDDAAMVSG